jgi:hypothetical protein
MKMNLHDFKILWALRMRNRTFARGAATRLGRRAAGRLPSRPLRGKVVHGRSELSCGAIPGVDQ